MRARVKELIDRKVAGEQITDTPSPAPRGQVIDLMEALKASLERRQTKAAEDPAGAEAAPKTAAAKRRAPAAESGSRAPRAARSSRPRGRKAG